MPAYNPGTAANLAVRSFLNSTGDYYLRKKIRPVTGQGKKDWERIRDVVFKNQCAYCGRKRKKIKGKKGDVTRVINELQREHLVMLNQEQYGLDHPGNIVPVCQGCNGREKKEVKNSAVKGKKPIKKYCSWQEQLKIICTRTNQGKKIFQRKKKILSHIKCELYPQFSKEEKHAIRVVAETLYKNVTDLVKKSDELYEKLQEAYVK